MDRTNPFVQLVSGVVWLLRNGEVYINQSLRVECDNMLDMGKNMGKHRPRLTTLALQRIVHQLHILFHL